MMALLLTDRGPELRSDAPTPLPQAGEALLRIRMAGICATDLELVRGYAGGFRGVLGHEFVGEVVDAPSDPTWVGKRVVSDINIGCGKCELCLRGLHNHCRHGAAIGIRKHDGAFAEYIALPIANLFVVPDEVSDDCAVFCEPLAAALRILEQVALSPASRVAVLGDGRLGQLIAQVLATTGCSLTLLGRTSAKLEIAARRGIQTCLTSDILPLPASDVVVEVTGTPEGFALARGIVRPGGTIVLKSTYARHLQEMDASSLVVDEISLIGSRCGPFAPALDLLRNGSVDPLPLISARFELSEGIAALKRAAESGVLKVLLHAGGEG
jgi:threonine dehydrogenase-like Zn-dependent dehydrogenase